MEYLKIKTTNRKGYIEAYPGDGVYTNIGSKRGTVQHKMVQTLTGFNDKGIVMDDFRIRKLTPKECWRLMGFDDEDLWDSMMKILKRQKPQVLVIASYISKPAILLW